MTPVSELAASAFWQELERVLACIQRHARDSNDRIGELPYSDSRNGNERSFTSVLGERGAPAADQPNPAGQLRAIFDLSPFELDTLLLCAGVAVDPRFQAACSAAMPDAHPLAPATFGAAMSVLDAPHWSALGGQRPLRYWRLLEIGPGPLLHAPLQIDERVLEFLLGVPALDDRLESLMHPLLCERSGLRERAGDAHRCPLAQQRARPAFCHREQHGAAQDTVLRRQ